MEIRGRQTSGNETLSYLKSYSFRSTLQVSMQASSSAGGLLFPLKIAAEAILAQDIASVGLQSKEYKYM